MYHSFIFWHTLATTVHETMVKTNTDTIVDYGGKLVGMEVFSFYLWDFSHHIHKNIGSLSASMVHETFTFHKR